MSASLYAADLEDTGGKPLYCDFNDTIFSDHSLAKHLMQPGKIRTAKPLECCSGGYEVNCFIGLDPMCAG